ncbi:MAG: 23S rRNA (uracil(1939)-C(5))-methyltransferase RlmD [Flavobacteriales bacterium]|nr:23S rRNA (uracil(1939)-C(5))-methyltransferase RlmD [Flavobacteriales bacterium]|tara:strand:- start:48188 stop:49603 length:1416 start_codon:yes stop_codon:yes gene_type:complete
MGRKKRKPFLLKEILITDTAFKGKSVAKYDGNVIFINGGVPGDLCDITVYKKKRKYWEARIEKIINYSEKRDKPKCEHFGVCGGCKWQNMNYKSQLQFKQKEVQNNLIKIGGINLKKINTIIGSKDQYYYRNKMEFTFSNKRWLNQEEIKSKKEIKNKNSLGFHIPGMFDKVLDLNTCHLQRDPSNKIRLSVKKFAEEHNLTFFDLKEQKGLLRNLLIRTASTNDLMVLVQFYEDNQISINLVLEHIKSSFPSITSLLYTINQKANNTIYDQQIICYHGKHYITEKIDSLQFKIGAKTFFQTNTNQTNILYQKTKELAKIKKNDIVYDLYTGTGTIAQYIANEAKKVIGIDSVEEGILAAKENAKINNIKNCLFYTGDMKEIFSDEFIEINGKPDIIITDPPRDGMHKKVVQQILRIQSKRIVYVSCNSATQSRDLSLLKEQYKVINIQPIDMFPQTHHVENILVLEHTIK